jgi:hypothetical protein
MFEKFKKTIQERIERNGVKIPNITWTEKVGKDELGNPKYITHTEDIILKRSTLPLIGDWMRIYPVLNEDGKTNWINLLFGGKKNLVRLLIILGLVAMMLFAYYEIFNQYGALREMCNPLLEMRG